MRPGGEADHSPPSSAEVKNAWSYTSTPQYVFMAWCLVKHSDNFSFTFLLLSLAPQLSLGLGLLHKIRLNFLEASQQFSFYRVGLLAPRQTPIPEDQTSVFIPPRDRVATHFSRLLRHAWVTRIKKGSKSVIRGDLMSFSTCDEKINKISIFGRFMYLQNYRSLILGLATSTHPPTHTMWECLQ
jgi:hypothetical protein